jgi:CTP:molybdopterin cytidylyltransferase MocA
VPVFNNKRGHPALFAKSLFKELVDAPAEQGARYVMYSNEDKVVEVETSESAVLVHIDTPEDYRSYFGTDP